MLKYGPDREPVITGIKRVSKPGLRRYVRGPRHPARAGRHGHLAFFPPPGVMVDHEARKQNVGGELICTVY